MTAPEQPDPVRGDPNGAPGEPTVPYDARRASGLIDREGCRPNDVLLHDPVPEPWEAMPVGGGDLSAMVRWRSPAPPPEQVRRLGLPGAADRAAGRAVLQQRELRAT